MSGMKILVVIRQAPDAGEPIRIRDGAVDLADAALVMDTMDEYGVEEALRLKDGGQAAEVVLLAAGPERVRAALQSGLAMGADRAIHIVTDEALDPVALSGVAAQIAREEDARLVLTGGQQADWDSQALGAATAERLGWPQATWTKALRIEAGYATGEHDLDEGSESFRVALPLVVTTQQGLNEPRYPTVPNIMKAKKKEVRRETLDRFGVIPMVKVVSVKSEVTERRHHVVNAPGDGAPRAAAELAAFLHDEVGLR